MTITLPKQPVQVLLIHNPFDAFSRGGMDRKLAKPGQTIREWVDQNLGKGWVTWDAPTLCQLNGKKMMRATWEKTRLEPGDVLTFSIIPEDPTTIILVIIAIIVAIVAVVMMPDPKSPEEGKQADSVFTWKGQDNRLRIGEPIECSYGRCRLWGSYAAPPYNYYRDNQSYTHVLLCKGQGEYEFEGDPDPVFYLEDTPSTSFEDVALEIIPPGNNPTLFKASAITSPEVSGIEMYGPNQPTFPVSGWHGPFIVNPSGSLITRIEIDIVFPGGLYVMEDGLRFGQSVGYEFEYQAIDDTGTPLGAWTDLSVGTISRRSATPQRATVGANIVSGRYQVRGKRTTAKNSGTSYVTTMNWESLKGFTPNSADYGNVTLVAMVAKASNNLNAQTRSRINCYATRKLPIWDPETETWSAPQATRNPIWAFCDIFRAGYGAKLTDEYLDLPQLAALAAIAEEREDWFDFTFDTRVTVWTAAEMALRVMRSVPIPQGSLVTAVRDQARTLPAAIFNHRNIVKGTFTKKLAMFEFQAKDALTIEYTDAATWKPETVTCVLPGYAGNFPAKLKLPGCTSRAQAYREGMYILAGRMYRRQVVGFETGMEGHIPTFMDLVAVQHEVVRFGSGGLIMAYDPGSKLMTLSQKVVFDGEDDHFIVVRGDDGAILGEPILATAGPKDHQVVLAEDPADELDFSMNRTPPLYVFGKQDRWAFLGNVSSIRPRGQTGVELTLNIYDARIHSFDDEPVPPLPLVNVIRDPDSPQIANVIIGTRPDDINTWQITWTPAEGAIRYIIERSYDEGATWEHVADVGPNNTFYEFSGVPGEIMVRVAAQSRIGAQGAWQVSTLTDLGGTGDPPGDVVLDAVQPDFTGMECVTKWTAVPGATGYTVEVHDAALVLLRRDVIGPATSYTYTLDMMNEDAAAPERQLEIRVAAYGYGATGNAATRNAFNVKPDALTGLMVTSMGGGDYKFEWDPLAVIPPDFLGYRLFVSATSGIPDMANLVYEGTDPEFTMNIPADRYWWVGAFDVWAKNATDANMGSQQFLDI